MKYWLSQLPLEVWVDVFSFPWISRKEFGQLVDKIGKHRFAEFMQFFLHEWGKHKLGRPLFIKGGYIADNKPLGLVPLTPLPSNIIAFNKIRISHFDARTLTFLGLIGSLLLTGVKLELFDIVPKYVDNLRTILTMLAPMLGGIRSMHCCESTLPMAMQCFSREQLAKLSVLKFRYLNYGAMGAARQQENVNTIMNWLAPPPAGQVNSNNTNDGPKLFAALLWSDHGFSEQISTAIRQQFLVANTPSTFSVILFVNRRDWIGQMAHIHLQNDIGEELHGVWTEVQGIFQTRSSFPFRCFQITRHRADCETELQEWVTANAKRKDYGCISFYDPTIGPLDASTQTDLPPVDEEQNVQQQQQPCSSKDTETSMVLREQFLAAKTPCTYTMNLMVPNRNSVAEFHLENGIGEVLHGEWAEDGRIFQVTRHQAGCNTQEVRAECFRVGTGHPTVGPLDVAQIGVPRVDGKLNIQQQPCSSKDT